MPALPVLRFVLICAVALAAGAGGVLALRYLRHADTQAVTTLPTIRSSGPISREAALQDLPQLDFQPFVRRFSLAQHGAAYYAPSLQGPTLYPLKTGTPLVSTAKSDDGYWVIALTEDGQAAYLPVSELGAFDASASPLTPAAAPQNDAPAPAAISGPAEVVDTATLSVNGQQVALAGMKGLGGDLAVQLGQGVAAHGGTVTCAPQGGAATYLCTLPDGVDVARLALFNRVAQPNDNASSD